MDSTVITVLLISIFTGPIIAAALIVFRESRRARGRAEELVDRQIQSAIMRETSVIAMDYFQKEDYDFFRQYGPLLGVKHTTPKYREDAEVFGVAFKGQLTRFEEVQQEIDAHNVRVDIEARLPKGPPKLHEPHSEPDYMLCEDGGVITSNSIAESINRAKQAVKFSRLL